MGVDAEDINGDGLPDLLVTNFANEYNTLHLSVVSGLFMDATSYYGLAADTVPFVGWGTALADLDNDGCPTTSSPTDTSTTTASSSGNITSTRSRPCSTST
jgi:hypothetical protein